MLPQDNLDELTAKILNLMGRYVRKTKFPKNISEGEIYDLMLSAAASAQINLISMISKKYDFSEAELKEVVEDLCGNTRKAMLDMIETNDVLYLTYDKHFKNEKIDKHR